MSEETTKPKDQPNHEPSGNSKNSSTGQDWVKEGFNKGERNEIGGGKAQSGDYGRGHTKPGGKPKEGK